MKISRFIILFFMSLALDSCAQVPLAVSSTSTSMPDPPTITQSPTPTITPTSTLTPTITPTFTPTPLGNSGQLYFSACNQSDLCTGIYSIDLNSYQLTPITDSGQLINISPDGRRMIINQDGQTYAMDSKGENKTALPNAMREILWLPDNQHIAYITYGNSQKNERYIYVSNWDGSDPKQITNDDDKPWSLIGISTSDNETRLYYGMADTSTNLIKPLGVKWINLDTGLQERVSQEGVKNESIDCSVHSNRMACIGGTWYLYLINVDNSKQIELIRSEDPSKEPPGALGQNMFWSPDGKKLIASTYLCKPKCDKSLLYVFSTADGELLRQSSEIDGLLFLAGVSPDGRLALLFGYQNDRFDSKPSIHILNLDDFTITDLSELELPVPQGSWHGTVQWLPYLNP